MKAESVAYDVKITAASSILSMKEIMSINNGEGEKYR